MFLLTVQQSANASTNVSQFDLSTLIAFVALIVSVLSPLITAIINNWFSYKMHHDEFHEKPAAEAIERYVSSCGAFIVNPTGTNEDNYFKSFGEILLYAPNDLFGAIEILNDDIFNLRYLEPEERHEARQDCLNQLAYISKELSKTTPRKN